MEPLIRPQVQIDVWSDYVCPYCYLELPVLEQLQKKFGQVLQIRWRAFELRPDPVPTLDPAGDYLRTTWDRSVYPMAARLGMTLRLPPVQPRSRKALEAAAYANAQGRFDPFHRATFRAFFEEGRDIGQIGVLLQIASSAGVDAEGLRHALEEDRQTEAVLQDERLAHDLGISAVPMIVLRRCEASWREALGVSGAQPYDRISHIVDAMLHGEMPSSI